MADRQIRFFQTPRQLGLHGAELHGVAARLEYRQDARMRPDFASQTVESCAYRRRVVRKIVVDGDHSTCTRNSPPHFHASADILETGQSFSGLGHRHTHMLSSDDGGQCVELVVHAGDVPAYPG